MDRPPSNKGIFRIKVSQCIHYLPRSHFWDSRKSESGLNIYESHQSPKNAFWVGNPCDGFQGSFPGTNSPSYVLDFLHRGFTLYSLPWRHFWGPLCRDFPIGESHQSPKNALWVGNPPDGVQGFFPELTPRDLPCGINIILGEYSLIVIFKSVIIRMLSSLHAQKWSVQLSQL